MGQVAFAYANGPIRLHNYVKVKKNVTENGVCMLSLSRVNISCMCLNMGPPKDFSGNFLVLHIGTRPSSVHGA